MKRLLAAASVALALAACNDRYASNQKSLSPIPPQTMSLMAEKGMSKGDPILVRLYKKESELEVWKKANDGKYALLKSFPICRWSGQLGPKQREGDRQAPEGFYTITPGQMNPNSAYYLSFDTGYPNAFDRAHNRTGSLLMVHGTCSSRGCYAMTDEGIAEVYALARESFSGGQRGFQFQAYPFRMTAENLAKFRNDQNMSFWKNLKEGSDHFEVTRREPKVAVCGGRYAFDTVGDGCAPDPTLAPVVAQKDQEDRRAVAELVGKGVPAVKLVYADGGQHESFRQTMMSVSGDEGRAFALLDARPGRNLGDVSRPDALAQGPSEIAVDAAGRPLPEGGAVTMLASAEPKGRAGRKVAPSTQLASLAVATHPKALSAPSGARQSQSGPARDTAATRPASKSTLVASADPDALPAAAPPAGGAKPFYERMMGNVFGAAEAPAATRAVAEDGSVAERRTDLAPTAAAKRKAASAAPAKPHPATAPKHPERVEAAPAPAPAPKPSAAAKIPVRPERHANAGGIIPGAQATGPTAGSFRPN